jgi:DNA adenine methylase
MRKANELPAAKEDTRVGAQPFLKWAGGKWAIAPRIASLLPKDVKERVYREPFLGGGAMFFFLEPEHAFLSDAVADLITTYEVVQSNVEPLIKRLQTLRASHSDEQFYEVRKRFNEDKKGAKVDRAAWLIYLNKTCYNGLFRTNRSGEFNVPAGRFKNPGVVDPAKLRLAAAMLTRAELTRAPFTELVSTAQKGDLIYLDPPYVPTSKTSNFSAYSDGTFSEKDHADLAEVYRELDARGCLLALSNSDTKLVRDLYAGFDIAPIIAPRAISSKASTRGEVCELLIRNIKRYPHH